MLVLTKLHFYSYLGCQSLHFWENPYMERQSVRFQKNICSRGYIRIVSQSSPGKKPIHMDCQSVHSSKGVHVYGPSVSPFVEESPCCAFPLNRSFFRNQTLHLSILDHRPQSTATGSRKSTTLHIWQGSSTRTLRVQSSCSGIPYSELHDFG